jgi:1-acyl-sn-glycerol-3-phosphate acyltransferase
MRILRVATRLVLVTIVTAASYAAWQSARFVSWRLPERRRQWRRRIIMGWAAVLLRILGVTLTTRGIPPSTPFFAVSNHLSYLDIICYAAKVDCVFIARGDLASWPAFGALAKSVDTIFIDRARHQDIPRAITEIERRLEQGCGIVLFPEGTSTKGEGVLPFRAGLLEPASRLNLSVYAAAISYRTPPGERPAFLSICWWGEMPFVGHFMEMLELSRCEASIEFLPNPVRNADRKVLAQELWSHVAGTFVPIIEASAERELLLSHPEYFPSWY